MNRFLANLIRIYQRTVSPDHGWFRARYPYGYCRFYPTCSEYARGAFITHGTIRGGWLVLRRLSRCHPWATPAIDPVPDHPPHV